MGEMPGRGPGRDPIPARRQRAFALPEFRGDVGGAEEGGL